MLTYLCPSANSYVWFTLSSIKRQQTVWWTIVSNRVAPFINENCYNSVYDTESLTTFVVGDCFIELKVF